MSLGSYNRVILFTPSFTRYLERYLFLKTHLPSRSRFPDSDPYLDLTWRRDIPSSFCLPLISIIPEHSLTFPKQKIRFTSFFGDLPKFTRLFKFVRIRLTTQFLTVSSPISVSSLRLILHNVNGDFLYSTIVSQLSPPLSLLVYNLYKTGTTYIVFN